MKNKKFLDSMNNISDSVFDKYYKYESRIEQSQAYRKRKFMKACALAACLTVCVCIGLALLLPAFIREDHNHTHPETYPNTLEETPSENSQPVETNKENEPPLETSEESEHVHDGNCDCFTGETAVVTQEESTFENERESAEDTTTTVETENTDPYEIRVDDNMVFIKDKTGCYVVIDDLYKYQTDSSHSGMKLGYIPFETMKDFKDTITKGLWNDGHKDYIAWAVRVYSNNKTCDLNNLYEPIMPQGSIIYEVGWNLDSYYFMIGKDDVYFGFLNVVSEENYNDIYVRDYENFLDEKDTVTKVENIDGVETIYYYWSHYSYKNVRYTLQSGNKTVIVDKKFDLGKSETVPYDIKLYCVEGNKYYIVNFDKVYDDPTDEWLLQFGLKRYVDEQDYANDMGIYSSTNLEFWIADNVDNFDFSEHQQRYGLMGGDEYYGKGYAPTYDDNGQQVDPEHCVIYTITSYPDYSDKEKHISRISITDPLVTLYGSINVNSTEEEFTRVMKANGFTVEREGAVGLIARKGDYFISLCLNEIVINVDIKNQHGIIF